MINCFALATLSTTGSIRGLSQGETATPLTLWFYIAGQTKQIIGSLCAPGLLVRILAQPARLFVHQRGFRLPPKPHDLTD